MNFNYIKHVTAHFKRSGAMIALWTKDLARIIPLTSYSGEQRVRLKDRRGIELPHVPFTHK